MDNGAFHGQGTEETESLAMALEQTFYDNFAPHRSGFQTHGRHASISQGTDPAVEAMVRSMSAQSQQQPLQNSNNITYTGILSLLTQDLVGLVTDQFGALGCHHVETGQARFFLSALANDDTQTMFDECQSDASSSPSAAPTGPLTELGQRQQTQLIDVWYSTHPLSFLVSKTLLLRELRDGTHDEVLLATIIGEASLHTGEEARGRALLRWAASQLRSRPLKGSHLTQNGVATSEAAAPTGISTRIFNGITTAQSLMLLGWNALTSARMRRATCYIGLAGKIVTQLKEQITTVADPKASSRINGIDVFDVEKEIIDHLYWTTYAICLWAFVQTGNQQFAPPLPATQPSIFVPVTEATSAIIQLDIVSDNFNTLHNQKAMIRETWPLAHIASVVAYICTFYPPDSDVALWQSGPPVAQQRLHNGQPPSMDVGMVCHEITRVLTESINHFNNQSGDAASRSLVLAAYHTLAIHFLFPAQKEEQFSLDTIDRFCSSAQEIFQSFSVICDQPQHPFNSSPSLRTMLPSIFTLAIDTCSRAFSFIHVRGGSTDGLLNSANAGYLEALAGRLYSLSKDEFLSQGSALRMARKQLKAFVRALSPDPAHHVQAPRHSSVGLPTHSTPAIRQGSFAPMAPRPSMHAEAPAAAHSSPIMGHASRSLSPAESDHLSTASTAAIDSSSSFIPPEEVGKLSSPAMSAASRHSPHTAATSVDPFSPSDIFKPSWQTSGPDELYQNSGTLNPNALGVGSSAPPSADPLCGSAGPDVVELQNAWFPQMTPHAMMDLDMAAAGSMNHVQWDWHDLHGDNQQVAAGGQWDMDSTA